MDNEEIVFVGTLVIVPAVGFLLGLWYFRRADGDKFTGPVYQFELSGLRFRFSSLDGKRFAYLLLLFGWVDVVFNTGLAVLIVFPAALGIGMARKVSGTLTSGDTQKLLEKLASVQDEISGAHQHVKVLSEDIRTKQTQVDDRERAKRALDELIRKKAEEAKGWSEQTEAQRQAFLETAVSAMSKESRGTFWWGLLLGFAINLLATLTWTMLGNPGRDDLVRRLKAIASVVQRDAEPRVAPDRTQTGGR